MRRHTKRLWVFVMDVYALVLLLVLLACSLEKQRGCQGVFLLFLEALFLRSACRSYPA